MLDSLPEHLLERTRAHDGNTVDGSPPATGFVLYWMRTAVRSDENPALDVARWIADRLGIPLLVYHAISEHYAYASDRHHTFMIQGASDVQDQMAKANISYAFHLATDFDRRPHLVALAEMASVVVTEDMPVDPPRRFLKALRRKTTTVILSVDTACVAPMQLIKKPYTRAFKFRSATKNFYADRLTRPWPEIDLKSKPFDMAQLPFEPIDLQTINIADLVARCKIDHSVGPIVDSVGGSAAGYRRWNEFKDGKLRAYAKQRNNALTDGVSRMSPYLHYGMVSPFRIAREAAAMENAGSEKYLDELLIWREMAYAFCFYRDDHDEWSAIPAWAQETLEQHGSDFRSETYSWEQLARGRTNDKLWNAAQNSLLAQGELHNNVRMTWGKAILNWKHNPRKALSTIIDLNHRYALDGRDPASYGGILWCLGQFDRPFEPERNILGTVRSRPSSNHATRLDVGNYLAKVSMPRFNPIPHVAVIGAGISGLYSARTLQDHGLRVTVFDKGRGVGGRMATRRDTGGVCFDHGAQYFTARDRRFIRHVDSWIEQGLVAKWPDRNQGKDQKIVVLENGSIKSESNSEDRFVGTPAMSSVCKHLAADLDVRTQVLVTHLNSNCDRVELFDAAEDSLGQFDRLVVSAPAAQTAELLKGFPALAEPISKIEMKPCWATMVAFEQPITNQWAGAFIHGSFLTWASRNNTKSGRNPEIECLTIHANPEWTASHWGCDANEVAELILAEFLSVAGIPRSSPSHLQAHRWNFAIPKEPSDSGCFADESSTIFACGDWASGSRVEGAFLSGMAAAGRILGTLRPAAKTKSSQTVLFN